MTNQEITHQITQVLEGNSAAFQPIYLEVIDPLYRFCYYRLQHTQQAEDVVQECVLKAYQRLGQYNPQKGTFTQWLYAIARTTLIDYLRRQRPTEAIDYAEDLPGSDDVPSRADQALALKAVDAALRKLHPERQLLIQLHYREELTFKEISERVGKSEAACKMATSRALEQLRSALAQA